VWWVQLRRAHGEFLSGLPARPGHPDRGFTVAP
jgi:hypothetical protein